MYTFEQKVHAAVYICIYVYIPMEAWIFLKSAYVRPCTHIYIYIYIYIYTHIYTHTYTQVQSSWLSNAT